MQLTDRVAVVTGAASGIGRATALALARKGAHVAVSDVDREGLATLADELSALGIRATTHVTDVADRVAMTAFADEVLAAHRAVHVLVNNAGVSVTATLEQQTWEDYDWIIGVNLHGVVAGCKIFLPHLLRAAPAHIVNVSSMFGFVGLPTQGAYCATKFAVRGFSESLRFELADRGVAVTCVHPGGIRTNIVRNSRFDESEHPGARARIQAHFERIAWPPERVADAIVRAIARRSARAVVGPEAHVTDWVARLVPTIPNDAIRWLLRRTVE